ncbi:MAG: 6-phosphogluconolactonase [Phycisphaerales bacterium]|nr:6-phosphogluconolactonase [Phycisphaerales bacterium]
MANPAHVVHVVESAAEVATAAAQRVAALIGASIAARGTAHVALAGGGTPKAMYAVLATLGGIDWSRVHLWWGDERCVPDTDKDSNQRTAREALLSKVSVPGAHVHRVRTELTPAACAEEYEIELGRVIGAGVPVIDVLLLGIGTDGHTLSLFPGSPALQERQKLVVATHAPAASPVRDRVTFTLPLARAARHRVFLATGAEKRPLVAACVGGGSEGQYPAAMVGASEWFLDRAAAP